MTDFPAARTLGEGVVDRSEKYGLPTGAVSACHALAFSDAVTPVCDE